MTKREQHARLDNFDGGLDIGLEGGPPGVCRKHGKAVVPGELAEAGVELGILAVRPGDAGLEVVDDPALRTAAERLQRPAVGHRPVLHALVGHRLGVDHVRMRQHGHEDLHIRVAAAAPEAQGLAREVGHAIEARRIVEARLRRPGPGLVTLLEEPAEAAVGVGLASLSQGFVAVLGPQLTARQADATALARRLELLDDRLPVGLHPVACATRHRIEPVPQCPVVEILWQRPGKACRLAAGQHMRDGSRAHPDRRGDLVP